MAGAPDIVWIGEVESYQNGKNAPTPRVFS